MKLIDRNCAPAQLGFVHRQTGRGKGREGSVCSWGCFVVVIMCICVEFLREVPACCCCCVCVCLCVCFFFRCCSYPIQKHGKLKTTDALGRTKTTIIGQPKRQQQQRGHGQQQRTGTRAEREKNQQRAIFSPKKKTGGNTIKNWQRRPPPRDGKTSKAKER